MKYHFKRDMPIDVTDRRSADIAADLACEDAAEMLRAAVADATERLKRDPVGFLADALTEVYDECDGVYTDLQRDLAVKMFLSRIASRRSSS